MLGPSVTTVESVLTTGGSKPEHEQSTLSGTYFLPNKASFENFNSVTVSVLAAEQTLYRNRVYYNRWRYTRQKYIRV